MPQKTKNLRPAGARAAQANRSQRNKARRIARNKPNDDGSMNPGHVQGLLRRRLRRLTKAAKDAGKERQDQISRRSKEIEALLVAV
jgi:hypothetical protein